jgi:hypothetical protein
MVEIKETSYKDERLGFFADQRKLVQKRYDRLEKQIKPDEPYLSERRQFLADCGRELSFYNDVIEMLENDVVQNSQFIKEIIDIVEQRMIVKRSLSQGVPFNTYSSGVYTGQLDAYQDIKEILEQKYLSE